ncbi:hypothetical protein V8F33_007415 [Rhypophila sp. PSN 637]
MLSAFTARPIIELKQRDKSKIESILAYGDRVLVGLNTGSLRIYRVNELPAPPTPSKSANGESSEPSQTSQPSVQVTDSDGGDPTAATTTAIAAAQTNEPAPPSDESPKKAAQPAQNPHKPTDLLREVEKFSNRPIEQLAIIKEANLLVSLSTYNGISLHDLSTFEPIESPLARTKGASAFAVTSNVVQDADTGVPEIISRLAVAVKRRLLLWSWNESELSPDVSEIVLSESIRSITWANATKAVCGMNGGYVIVDVKTGDVEDIVGPGAIGGAAGGQGRFGAVSAAGMGYMGLGSYMPKPLSAKLAEGELLLAKDINTLFINDSGKALEKRQVPWQAAPEAIGYSYPYILALQPPTKGSLEVRNPDTLHLLQTIALAGAAQLHFPPPTVSLVHKGKGFHVLSDRAVWKMDATDYDSQVEELVAHGNYDEAISILNMLEDALLKDKTETMREVKMLKAELLFSKKKYRESMDLFNEDGVHAPPERVLKLYPKIIAGDLSGVVEEDKTDESEDEEPDNKANGEKAAESDVAVSSPQKASGGFAKYLMGHRSKLNPETASIASKKDVDDAASIKASKRAEERAQSEKDLKEAVRELNSYLAGTRQRLQRVIDPATGKLKSKEQNGSTDDSVKSLLKSSSNEDDENLEKELQETFKIVDTTLFRAYMYAAPSLASSLFRIHNFCDPDVVNERLLEHNQFTELVDFFYGKKLHRQALDLLRKFGSPEEPDELAPKLHGPERTVLYLKGLPPEMIDVILEFSEWTLKKKPQLGMEVFLEDSENAETLPRDRVIDFLGGIDSKLEIEYLEHIITELNDSTHEFHNRLVDRFIKELLRDGSEKGPEWDSLMERLITFLETGQYSPNRAFRLIPKDDARFYEAQAVVLCKMQQHKQALEVYVFKMQDYTKAEEYCNRIYKTHDSRPTSTSPERDVGYNAILSSQFGGSPRPYSSTTTEDTQQSSIYNTLLALYLTPPPPHQPNLGPALDLLSKHGSRLPATSTLSLIPDTLPVAQLESYFRGRMRNANSIVNETFVVKALREAELVATQARLRFGDAVPWGVAPGGMHRQVVISEERVCRVCHKRLARSVVAVLPDDGVVHYGCLKRAQAQGLGQGQGQTTQGGQIYGQQGMGMPTAAAGSRPGSGMAGSWGRSG